MSSMTRKRDSRDPGRLKIRKMLAPVKIKSALPPPKKKSGVWRRGEIGKGEIAILGCGDHIRNMLGTSLHTAYCRQTIALETAEIMQ